MRRSAFVYAPILAAAALSLPMAPRVAGQQTTASTEQQITTVRNGFGNSFREHPLLWILGTAWAGIIIFSPGG